MKRETSIKFFVQNLRIGGHQTADHQGQRTDTLGRTGQANELYSRARRFRELVKKNDPDVILTQECSTGWADWMVKDAHMAATYGLVYHWDGTNPPGMQSASPILFKKETYALEESGCFWFSETPDVISLPYCTEKEHPRIVSWTQLRDRKTGVSFRVYSIHMPNYRPRPLDPVGVKSMTQLVNLFGDLPEGIYAFAGGDFNIDYRDDVYEHCLDWTKMIDLKDQALNTGAEIGGNTGSVCPRYQKPETGGNYGTPEIIEAAPNSQALDHLMAKPHPNIAVDYWGYDYTHMASPEENVADGYVSDHYGLTVKLRIQTDEDHSEYQKKH